MKGLKNLSLKFHRLTYKVKHGLSIENIILAVAVFLCLFWTYQSIVSMSRNWSLSERLNTEKTTLELARIEVEAAELENDYYRTNEYQESAARKFAGKQPPGESLVYLPANSEAAKNKHRAETAENKTKEYSNPEKWLLFLFPSS